MARMLTIIGCTLAFALIGLGVAYIAVQNVPNPRPWQGTDVNLVVTLSVLPPLFGSLLGFVVGCAASFIGRNNGT
jgi:hypothetical protein